MWRRHSSWEKGIFYYFSFDKKSAFRVLQICALYLFLFFYMRAFVKSSLKHGEKNLEKMFTRKQRQKCPYKNHEVKTFVKSFISSQKSKVLSVFSLLSAYLTRRILSDKIEQNGFYFPVGKIARCMKESVFFARVRCLNRKYFPSHLFF